MNQSDKYRILCPNTFFTKGKEKLHSYEPTGKYRVYNDGYMDIEFKASTITPRFLTRGLVSIRTAWIPENMIIFKDPITYKEFPSEG